jgi:hypothetical protein
MHLCNRAMISYRNPVILAMNSARSVHLSAQDRNRRVRAEHLTRSFTAALVIQAAADIAHPITGPASLSPACSIT